MVSEPAANGLASSRSMISAARPETVVGVSGSAATASIGVADTLGRLAPDTYPPTVQATIADAATAVYVADRAVGETLFGEHDADAYQAAVEKVTGSFTRINGAEVPAPQGMTVSRFSGLFDSLTDDDLKAAGGAFAVGGHRFDAAFLRHNAVLRPTSLGGTVYGVYLPQGGELRPVMTANRSGAPLVLDFSSLDDLRGRFVRNAPGGLGNQPAPVTPAGVPPIQPRGLGNQ